MPRPLMRDVNEWSVHFWAQLARFVDGAHHSGMVLDVGNHRLHIEPTGSSGGLIRLYRREGGKLREASSIPFALDQPPVAVARDVALRLRAPGSADLIDAMHKSDLIRTLRRVQSQAPGSNDAATLETWVQRLVPYMDREPGLTVAEALKKYDADARRR
jgi:hypothetical protein